MAVKGKKWIDFLKIQFKVSVGGGKPISGFCIQNRTTQDCLRTPVHGAKSSGYNAKDCLYFEEVW